jgi:[ribosomal protein S5]-alanine N-acetyltransferase
MSLQPILTANRLILRPFALSDASEVQRLAGDRAIADTTKSIPHPYKDGLAEQWITKHRQRFEAGAEVNFAVVLSGKGCLAGAISLSIFSCHSRAELGYWIGRHFWNNGYCTEAARAVTAYGFETLGLNRLYASVLKRNPASQHVLEKIGMQCEGCLRSHDKKWDVLEDVAIYGMLRSEQGKETSHISQ